MVRVHANRLRKLYKDVMETGEHIDVLFCSQLGNIEICFEVEVSSQYQ